MWLGPYRRGAFTAVTLTVLLIPSLTGVTGYGSRVAGSTEKPGSYLAEPSCGTVWCTSPNFKVFTSVDVLKRSVALDPFKK